MAILIDTYYLIDFENVGNDGLSGCDKLNKTDHIHLFYTENAKKIDLDIFGNHGEAEIITHKVPVGKQSADMHLGSFLGYLIGINQGKDCTFIVVSKDTDFDNMIKFWKEETKARASRSQAIKPPAEVKEAPVKQTAKKKGDIKTNLNQDVQQALSQAKFDNRIINDVAQLVTGYYGEEHLMSKVHNELRKKYEDYLKVYEAIKPVISKYATAAADAGTGHSSGSDRTAVNSEIQKVLSKAGEESEVINYVASTVVKNIDVKNGKQQTYRTIISKYGQKKGLDLYSRVKKHIP